MSLKRIACTQCGRYWHVEHTTGAVPSVCSDCDPEGAARREHARKASALRRQEAADTERAIRERLAYYEGPAAKIELVSPELRAVQAALRNTDLRGVERRDIAAAVRTLGYASGATATHQALLRLATFCLAWATRLGAKGAMPAAAHLSDEHDGRIGPRLSSSATTAAAAETSTGCAGRQPRHLQLVSSS